MHVRLICALNYYLLILHRDVPVIARKHSKKLSTNDVKSHDTFFVSNPAISLTNKSNLLHFSA